MTARPHEQAVTFTLERPERAALEAQWRGLEARTDITFFLSWDWIGAWIDEAGLPDVVLAGRAGGELVCLGLLRRSVDRRHGVVRSRTLHLHATGCEDQDVIFIEYNGLLTDRRFAPLEAQALAFLRSRQKEIGRFDEVGFGGFAEDRYQAVRTAGQRTHVHALKSTAFVDLAALRVSGDDYLATLSANTRQQIRRAVRIYEARGPLALEPARSVEEALEFFDAMGALHEAAWRGKGDDGGAWRFPFLVAFHRRVIARSFAKGGVEIVRVSCGGQAIGYIYCLVRGGWIGSYLSGFAYEADNKVKPGLVSFCLYIQHRLKTGGDVFDFLAGDHRYKTSLGTLGPSIYWFRAQERRPQFLLERALRRAKQWVERVRARGER
ncbi:MAG TPA: GNAT family N-acetyltransferase [Allosphingosinicella sp.]|nr:GNAT family N-acetyltransferase [Allosphingosinicella sp.]